MTNDFFDFYLVVVFDYVQRTKLHPPLIID